MDHFVQPCKFNYPLPAALLEWSAIPLHPRALLIIKYGSSCCVSEHNGLLLIESNVRSPHIRVYSGRFFPRAGNPTISHDGLGAPLLQQGTFPTSVFLFGLGHGLHHFIDLSRVQMNHQNSLLDPIGGQCCPLLLCYGQPILVCSMHFRSRHSKADHRTELSVQYCANQVRWHGH